MATIIKPHETITQIVGKNGGGDNAQCAALGDNVFLLSFPTKGLPTGGRGFPLLYRMSLWYDNSVASLLTFRIFVGNWVSQGSGHVIQEWAKHHSRIDHDGRSFLEIPFVQKDNPLPCPVLSIELRFSSPIIQGAEEEEEEEEEEEGILDFRVMSEWVAHPETLVFDAPITTEGDNISVSYPCYLVTGLGGTEPLGVSRDEDETYFLPRLRDSSGCLPAMVLIETQPGVYVTDVSWESDSEKDDEEATEDDNDSHGMINSDHTEPPSLLNQKTQNALRIQQCLALLGLLPEEDSVGDLSQTKKLSLPAIKSNKPMKTGSTSRDIMHMSNCHLLQLDSLGNPPDGRRRDHVRVMMRGHEIPEDFYCCRVWSLFHSKLEIVLRKPAESQGVPSFEKMVFKHTDAHERIKN